MLNKTNYVEKTIYNNDSFIVNYLYNNGQSSLFVIDKLSNKELTILYEESFYNNTNESFTRKGYNTFVKK